MAYDREVEVERICAELADGFSLVAICARDDMPGTRTVQEWMAADEAISAQITRAREEGYQVRAERAVLEAKTAEDAPLGRLAFDAERWYLGKLSNAFSDNKPQKVEQTHKVDPEVASWLGLKS